MKRKIEAFLNEWKDRQNRKPLIIRGARQVGKTYSVLAFGKAYFERVVGFDLEQRRDCHDIFDQDLQADRLVTELEIIAGQRIVPGETLLFLDEIQACPRALMSLRYFYEQIPNLHVIAAGSLLEFSLHEHSFPVGRVEFAWLYPLDFDEYLSALDLEILVQKRPEIFGVDTQLSKSTHAAYRKHLKDYILVGGMPEAVSIYRQTGSLLEVGRVHDSILTSYRADLSKYSNRVDRDVLSTVFDAMPRQIGKQIKYTALYPGARIEKIKSALQLLEQALIVRRVTATSGQGRPLRAQTNEKIFKLIFFDIGLLRSLTGLDPSEILQSEQLIDTFRGALAEQYVGQELLAAGGSEDNNLYYWVRTKKGSSAEVDYVLVWDGQIWPLEVKSGPAGKLKSMQIFLEKITKAHSGLVLHDDLFKKSHAGQILFAPLYARFPHS